MQLLRCRKIVIQLSLVLDIPNLSLHNSRTSSPAEDLYPLLHLQGDIKIGCSVTKWEKGVLWARDPWFFFYVTAIVMTRVYSRVFDSTSSLSYRTLAYTSFHDFQELVTITRTGEGV